MTAIWGRPSIAELRAADPLAHLQHDAHVRASEAWSANAVHRLLATLADRDQRRGYNHRPPRRDNYQFDVGRECEQQGVAYGDLGNV